MSNVVKPLLQLFGTVASVAGGPLVGAAANAGLQALGGAIDKTQQNARLAQQPVGANATPNTIVVTFPAPSTFRPFAHKLGRKWTGFQVVENGAGISVSSRRGGRDELFIELSGSGADTVTVQVF
jgi:hypothetical protein